MTLTYTFKFTGRKVNAIGIVYPIEAEVEATSTEEAERRLYEDYEHIQGLKLVRAAR